MFATVKAYVEERVGDAVRRAMRNVVLLLAACLFILIGFMFALFALYQYAAAEIGPVAAASAIAGGLVVLAGILVLIARAGGNRAAPQRKPVALDQTLADEAVAALGLDDPKRRKNLLYQTLAAAVLAGFYAGRKVG